MKHTIAMLGVLTLALSLVACGDDSSSGEADSSNGATSNATSNGTTGADTSNATSASNTTTGTTGGGTTGGGTTGGETTTDCAYPTSAARYLEYNTIAPAMAWEGVFKGGDGERIDFSMEAFHCDPAYAQYQTMVIVVGAGWCVACPDYIRYVNEQAAALDAAGMLVVFVEAEDANSIPSDHEGANAFINRLIGPEHGLRIGDGETMPETRQIYNSPTLEAFPSAYVVRRSDMVVITEQRLSQYLLPLGNIAERPDDDWSNPEPEFEPNCTEADEEEYEPNDDPSTAPTIGLGAFDGGVCAPAADYYMVDVEGDWRVDLEFSHAQGDLDLYVWDTETNAPLFGSESIDDNESIQWYGPATIMIYGYQFASATYTLTVSESEPVCADGLDDTEPDNTPEEATPLEPGTIAGGICDPNPDFYTIDLAGDWRLDLEFSHDEADLDVYAWDVEGEQPLLQEDGMTPIGSYSTDSSESFEHSGPTTIIIVGYQGARAPYSLTLTELAR